jgi:hypothetical protein
MISDLAMFKKGSESPSKWSDEANVVQSPSGKTVRLTDGQMLRQNSVLLVPLFKNFHTLQS